MSEDFYRCLSERTGKQSSYFWLRMWKKVTFSLTPFLTDFSPETYKTLIVILDQTSSPSLNCPSVYWLNPSCTPTRHCPPANLQCARPFSTNFLAFFFFFCFLLICRSFWLTPVPVVPLLLSSSLLFFYFTL